MASKSHIKRQSAILQMEDSVNRVAMLLELVGDSLAVRAENSNSKTGGNFAAGLLLTVDDLKSNLIADYEAAVAEWRQSKQEAGELARN